MKEGIEASSLQSVRGSSRILSPRTYGAQGIPSHKIGSAGHAQGNTVLSTLHSILSAFLWPGGNWTNRKITCSENIDSIKNSATLCRGRIIHVWIPSPEELSYVVSIRTLSQRLATDWGRGFRSLILRISKPLFLLEIAACSQVYPQVAYCGVLCVFSRRLLLNVNMLFRGHLYKLLTLKHVLVCAICREQHRFMTLDRSSKEILELHTLHGWG